jgi:hypothetical protein
LHVSDPPQYGHRRHVPARRSASPCNPCRNARPCSMMFMGSTTEVVRHLLLVAEPSCRWRLAPSQLTHTL